MAVKNAWIPLAGFVAVLTAGGLVRAQSAGSAARVSEDGAGVWRIERTGERWVNDAIELMGKTLNKIVLYRGVFSPPASSMERVQGDAIRVPEGADGIRALARMMGGGVIERAKGVYVVQRDPCGDCASEGIWILAQREAELNGGRYIAAPEGLLAWELSRSASVSLRQALPGILQTDVVLTTLFWPSREGDGSEVYAVQQSSASLTNVERTGLRYLRKVRIASVLADRVGVVDIWPGAEPGETGVVLPGPLTDLALDWDGDGVVDIAALTDLPGSWAAGSPLTIISGRSGAKLGVVEGFGFVVSRRADGEPVQITALDSEATRTYEFRDGRFGAVSVVSRVDVKGSEKRTDSAQIEAELPTLQRFLMPLTPAGLKKSDYRSFRTLKTFGQDLTARPKAANMTGVLAVSLPAERGAK
jgi:hypothetical protein